MSIIRGFSLQLADTKDLATSWNTDIVDAAGLTIASIHYVIPSNTHVGSLQLYAGEYPDLTTMQPSRWFSNALANQTTGALAVTSGAAFNGAMTFNQCMQRYFAVKWVATSGAGNASLYFSGK